MNSIYRFRPCPECDNPELPEVLNSRGWCDGCDAQRDTIPCPPPTEATPPLSLEELAALEPPAWPDEAITLVDCPHPPGAR